MARIASFQLVRERRAILAMSRLALDRRSLRGTPGLVFWRLLGTGAGSSTGPGADLRRTATFAVWEDEGALDAHLAAQAPRLDAADEQYVVRMRSAAGHGSWRGVPVVDLLPPSATTEAAGGSHRPVAIVTRADVRVRSWRAFRRAGPGVSAELAAADGLLAVVGIGEAPVGRLGTFSLWRDLAAARAFAYEQPQHLDVVRRTRAERWYGEELFARFEPYAASGSWDGRDPLRGLIGTSIP